MNICRPITFFNNFVPPSNQRQEWEYEALGYFDGISIGDNIIKDTEFDLRQMRDALETLAKEFKGEYTAQIIHIFRHESENETNTDEIFWEQDEKTYPFLFIVMLRLNKESSEIRKVKTKLEEELCTDEVRVITYLTLDNNDLIVVLKSKEYVCGASVIDRFHQKEETGKGQLLIYDSFSICGISKQCLNHDKRMN